MTTPPTGSDYGKAGARFVAQPLAHAGRRNDLALLDAGFLVLFDRPEIIEAIDHQSMRLMRALRRAIGEKAHAIFIHPAQEFKFCRQKMPANANTGSPVAVEDNILPGVLAPGKPL